MRAENTSSIDEQESVTQESVAHRIFTEIHKLEERGLQPVAIIMSPVLKNQFLSSSIPIAYESSSGREHDRILVFGLPVYTITELGDKSLRVLCEDEWRREL